MDTVGPTALPGGGSPDARDLQEIEIDLLLEGVYRRYALDFRGYARGSLRRRLQRRLYAERVSSMSALQDLVLHDPAAMDRLLMDLSINVTSMFRDPAFFLAFRERVVPLLRTYPFIRVWNITWRSIPHESERPRPSSP